MNNRSKAITEENKVEKSLCKCLNSSEYMLYQIRLCSVSSTNSAAVRLPLAELFRMSISETFEKAVTML